MHHQGDVEQRQESGIMGENERVGRRLRNREQEEGRGGERKEEEGGEGRGRRRKEGRGRKEVNSQGDAFPLPPSPVRQQLLWSATRLTNSAMSHRCTNPLTIFTEQYCQ